jgi:hypothetical protein
MFLSACPGGTPDYRCKINLFCAPRTTSRAAITERKAIGVVQYSGNLRTELCAARRKSLAVRDYRRENQFAKLVGDSNELSNSERCKMSVAAL